MDTSRDGRVSADEFVGLVQKVDMLKDEDARVRSAVVETLSELQPVNVRIPSARQVSELQPTDLMQNNQLFLYRNVFMLFFCWGFFLVLGLPNVAARM